MYKYKNNSISAKTFYGVTIEPGKIGEVPGCINVPYMEYLGESDSKKSTSATKVEPKSPKSNKEEDK